MVPLQFFDPNARNPRTNPEMLTQEPEAALKFYENLVKNKPEDLPTRLKKQAELDYERAKQSVAAKSGLEAQMQGAESTKIVKLTPIDVDISRISRIRKEIADGFAKIENK